VDIQTISSKKSADYIHNITTNIGQIKSYKNGMSLVFEKYSQLPFSLLDYLKSLSVVGFLRKKTGNIISFLWILFLIFNNYNFHKIREKEQKF